MASWDVELSEPLALKSGEMRFRTLRDAAEFLASRYSRARGGVLAGAIEDLMAAAEDPSAERVRQATDQFALFLSDEMLADPLPARPGQGDIPQRIAAMLAPGGRKARRPGR